MILICIPPMTNEAEPFSYVYCHVDIYSLLRNVSSLLPIFLLSCPPSLIVWVLYLFWSVVLVRYLYEKYHLQHCGLFFSLLCNVSFFEQMFLLLINSNISSSPLCGLCCYVSCLKESLSGPRLWRCSFILSSSHWVLIFTFHSDPQIIWNWVFSIG